MWKVITSFNLNPLLKLFFYSLILTNNNLLFKIYCKNIVKILSQYFSIRIFLLFFFLSFHFHPYTFHFFFLFLVFLLHTSVQPPFFYFLFLLKNIPASHICFTSEKRERRKKESSFAALSSVEIEVAERTKPVEIGVHMQHYHVRCPTAACRPPHHQAGSDWLVPFFFFFHICLF